MRFFRCAIPLKIHHSCFKDKTWHNIKILQLISVRLNIMLQEFNKATVCPQILGTRQDNADFMQACLKETQSHRFPVGLSCWKNEIRQRPFQILYNIVLHWAFSASRVRPIWHAWISERNMLNRLPPSLSSPKRIHRSPVTTLPFIKLLLILDSIGTLSAHATLVDMFQLKMQKRNDYFVE